MELMTRRGLFGRLLVTPGLAVVAMAAGTAISANEALADDLGYDHSCTGWCALRLQQHGFSIPRGLGNATTWFDACSWRKSSNLVVAGSVACWRSTTSNPNGHVAYVEAVEPPCIRVSEAGWNGKPFETYVHWDVLGANNINGSGRGRFAGFLIPPALWARGNSYGFRSLGHSGWWSWK